MKLKRGELDGAQPRDHVVAVLKKHGCDVTHLENDEYLVANGDYAEVLDLLDPIVSELVVHLWRRFSNGDWPIIEFVYTPPKPRCH